ncbi:hypothetical protein BCU83_02960 [Vibrio breoganii]|uniref:carboxypeptidase-like regulatory domain-containing protein n=1 Tax=Vibrio breoganii TaxID=553239 RepID=UPI000C86054C|nr:carboxypeptidase-like regulatory domain-containing protein [Vibrio breoganii]PMG75481.1 hypothetical protein BCU83_02960 [Vibrio breoganii]
MKNLLHVAVLSLFLMGCGDDDLYKTSIPILEEGVLGVQILDIDGVEVDGARISIFDDNNVFVTSAFTDSIGERSFELQEGVYTIKVAAQGYIPSPVQGGIAIPVQINGGEATDRSIPLTFDPNAANTTYIQGNANIRGNLVVISDDANAYSTFTDSNGNYYLYNIPAGSNYKLTSYHTGYETDLLDVSLSVDTPILDKNINARQSSALPELTGSVTFLATKNGTVDITVTLPETGDVIPGAVTYTSGTYTMNDLPKGQFKVWATYNNDGYVMDPDWIAKNGGEDSALGLVVNSSNLTKNFSVTGAVELVSPTNSLDEVTPKVISTTTPTFEWKAYSSAQDYAVEVTDIDGNLVWGGVEWSGDEAAPIATPKHGSIGSVTSIKYNFDNNPETPSLEDGQLYKWSVTAINTGNTAISTSENQVGIIKVELPQ